MSTSTVAVSTGTVSTPSVTVVGRGRAGRSFATALRSSGWSVTELAGRSGPRRVDPGTDLVLVCVPDAVVGAVAAELDVTAGAVVAHCAGSLGTDVLGARARTGSIHPLVALPDAERGAARLRGAWFAVSGDPLVSEVVAALGGRRVVVDDDSRRRYHAAASVAANHLVALMAQVERLAPDGVPLDAYLDLARGALADVAEVGPAAALTGPVARGDLSTVEGHLDAIAPDERALYLALADAAAHLAGTPAPSSVRSTRP